MIGGNIFEHICIGYITLLLKNMYKVTIVVIGLYLNVTNSAQNVTNAAQNVTNAAQNVTNAAQNVTNAALVS